jgi:hypothetical protein
MQKKQNTKEMTGGDRGSANKSLPSKLRCLRECIMPGIGHFQEGDVIEDEGKIALIADNPNFSAQEE